MKRKKFISTLAFGAGGAMVFPSLLACAKNGNDTVTPDGKDTVVKPIDTKGNVRFGVITDVHYDYFPDAGERLAKFIAAANTENLDFIIQVGDFVYPQIKNSGFMEIWNGYKGPKFHVLGNHDMDVSTKASFLDFVNQSQLGAFYSYDHGGFHFVVLDTNYIKQGGKYIHYANRNYADHPGSEIGFVSDEELAWLRDDLAKTDKPTVVFSHQPLNGSAGNSSLVQQIFKDENAKGKKVIASLSGHLHKNWHLEIDQVHHVQVNSASYFFVGRQFPLVPGRYSADVEAKYPILPQMAPYDDSLFAIMELDGPSRTLSIEGRESNFLPPTPYELGYYTKKDQMSPSSNIDSRSLKF